MYLYEPLTCSFIHFSMDDWSDPSEHVISAIGTFSIFVFVFPQCGQTISKVTGSKLYILL